MTTNINCSTDCVHQDCGKCSLNQVGITSAIGNENCAHFKKKDNKVKNLKNNKDCMGPNCK